MKKILIVSGHPDLNDSFANKTILEETKNYYQRLNSYIWISYIRIFKLM